MFPVTQFEAQEKLLGLPVAREAPLTRAQIVVDGEVQRRFDIRLADRAADFWVAADIGRWRGQQVSLLAERRDLRGLSVVQSDALPDAGDLYGERYRPQFHMTPQRGWMNDPNGLSYYDGRYHLFFQHNPYGTDWGNMHWGHAASTDLVHWQELGEALYPDDLGACFSGSGVVDWENTSGLGNADDPPLVCAYTSAGEPFVQSLAYSVDGGDSWQPFDGNPVVPHLVGRNRDPKVIWHEPSGQWVMALYLESHDYALLTSGDLRSWEVVQELSLPGCSECPDLFPLPVDGDPAAVRWVFWGANGTYLVGEFDGHTFTPQQAPARFAARGDSYAAQTWSEIPAEDGRRIQIAWLRGDLPEMPFNQQMTLPHRLALRSTPRGMRLAAEPVAELGTLRQESYQWGDLVVRSGHDPLRDVRGRLLDVRAEVALGTTPGFGLQVCGVPIVYDAAEQRLRCQGRALVCPDRDGIVRLRVLVDRASVEIYANDGLTVLPLRVLVAQRGSAMRTLVRGEEVAFQRLQVDVLQSIW